MNGALRTIAITALGAWLGLASRAAVPAEEKPALAVEISCDMLKTTADRQPTFTVTIRNLSGALLRIPAPDSFTERAPPDYKDYHAQPLHAQPLYPVITPVRDPKPTVWSGGHIEIEQAVARIAEIPAGEKLSLKDVTLAQEYFVVGQERVYNGKTCQVHHALLPESATRVAFCFENEQAQIGGKDVWIGKVVSNELEITVNPAPVADLGITGEFTLPKGTFFLGEPINVVFKATNQGEKAVFFPAGGDYRGSGRHDRFSFTAVDEAGKPVRDPVKPSGMGGGLGGDATIKPGGAYSETLLLNQWCAFEKPGKYAVTCRRTLNVTVEGRDSASGLIEALMPAVPVETKLTVVIFRDDKALAERLAQLEEGLKSPNWREAGAEMRTLAFAKCEPAFAVIERTARGGGPAQSEALRWLAAYGADRALPALKAAAGGGTPTGRIAAMLILAEADAKGTAAVVNAALQSKDAEERRAAVDLCARHKYPECLPALLEMGNDDDIIVRRYLGAALGASGDARAVPVLLKLLQDKDPDHFIKIWAAGGLGKLGRKDGIPVMIELLRLDETKSYRGNVVATLEELTGVKMKYNTDYESWHDWWEKEGRAKYEKIDH